MKNGMKNLKIGWINKTKYVNKDDNSRNVEKIKLKND